MRIEFAKGFISGGLSIGAVTFAVLAFSACAIAAGGAEETSNPAISGYGGIHAVNEKKTSYKLSPHAVSKLIFQVYRTAHEPSEVNPDLEKVARAINLMVADGVPIDHINAVVLIGGSAADVALDSAAYRKNFGVDNPNLDLLKKLNAVGVAIVVSDQALATRNLNASALVNVASTALSSFTTITSLEQAGYSLAAL